MHHLEHLLMIASLRARNMGKRKLADDLHKLASISAAYMPADFDPMETQSGPLNDQWSKKYRGLDYPKPKRSLTMKTLTLALALTALAVNLADAAGQRCRTSKMGTLPTRPARTRRSAAARTAWVRPPTQTAIGDAHATRWLANPARRRVR